MQPDTEKNIVVMGVGNILLKDEGIGVRVVEALAERFEFPPNVELVDGGVLGLSLLGVVREAGRLIVVDAVRLGDPPGTLHRLAGDDIPDRVYKKTSLHQVDLVEALTICRNLWEMPPTVILGVEPLDITPWGVELTEPVAARMEDLILKVLEELSALGLQWRESSEDPKTRQDHWTERRL